MPFAKNSLSSFALGTASLAAPDGAAQPDVFYAQSGDVRIAFEFVGDGEPLVMIPGFSQSRQAWRDAGFVDRLAACGHRVILVDPRGHGDSFTPRDAATYQRHHLATDIVAVLDQLNIEKADLLGYSRGGAIAIATAIVHPDRVRRLVLGGAHPYAEDLSPFREAVAPGLETWIDVIESSVGPLPDHARAMFLANDVQALRAAVAQDRPDLSAELAATSIPILLYAGSQDPRAPSARRFADETGAAYLELEGLNHFEAFFAAEPVLRAIGMWCAGEVSRRGSAPGGVMQSASSPGAR